MATEVWAKEVEGTGLTINIVNPGAGANTPGMADEMRTMSREGRAPRLVEPEEMVPPLLWVVSAAADGVNGYRFDANLWDPALPPAEAARRAGRPAGFEDIALGRGDVELLLVAEDSPGELAAVIGADDRCRRIGAGRPQVLFGQACGTDGQDANTLAGRQHALDERDLHQARCGNR